MMNFLSKEYLPHSQGRVARLRKIINGRPVAILAAGPSIQELEERIEELRGADICYFGINKFFVEESHILKQIDQHISVVSCSGREGMPEVIKPISDFLNRDEDNMFITSFWRDPFGLLDKSFDLNKFLDRYDTKLLLFSLDPGRTFPNNEHPLHFIESNSLLVLIQMALIGGASSIVLFGADGHGGKGGKQHYYHQDEHEIKEWSGVNECLMNDTMCFFNPLAALAIRNTCKTYGLAFVNILNCSPKSFYTPFPKVSYDDAFEYLLKGKKIIGKLDLRVPMKPKKSNVYLLFIEKVFNFCKKYRCDSIGILVGRFGNKSNYAK